MKNKAFFFLIAACVPAFSEAQNTSVAVNTATTSMTQENPRDDGKAGSIRFAPEDLNARGIELENTFYEIEGRPPYSLSKPASEMPSEYPETESRALPQKMLIPKWPIWAAGAAGLVGLGAIGYLTLSDDASKTPEKKVTLIVDK